VLHRITFITACAQSVYLQHEFKWWTFTLLANKFNNCMTQNGSLAVHFSSSTYNLKMTTIMSNE